MCKLHFGPLITAVVTPFNEQQQIDVKQFAKLLQHLVNKKSTALVVTGITGEASTLNSIEKLTIWEAALDYTDGKVPIIVGVGTNNTQTTIHNIKLAEEACVDALLVVTPYYNIPSQKGILKHFQMVSQATELPIILHNDPARCGTKLELETILELAKLSNIIGITDSTGNTKLLRKLKEKLDDDFLLYTGSDTLYHQTLALGGTGVISVTSHLVGNSMKDIFDLYHANQSQQAQHLDAKLAPLYQIIDTYPNPPIIKALLNKSGMNVGGVRLPLANLEDHEVDELWETTKELID